MRVIIFSIIKENIGFHFLVKNRSLLGGCHEIGVKINNVQVIKLFNTEIIYDMWAKRIFNPIYKNKIM